MNLESQNAPSRPAATPTDPGTRSAPLRAGDALQLGAALIWAEDPPDSHRFCTLDDRLGMAARLEGFTPVEF